jgi:type I restriction enzyme S subunit
MNGNSLKPGWKMVKFGDVVKNANLVERDPQGADIERIVGLEHLDPENLHIRRWNSPDDGTSFTRKFVPGQTLFGKRRAYQRKVAFAEFAGICSGDILTFESKDPKTLLPELLPFICQTEAFFDYALGTSAGSLSPRTSWNALKNFEFPLPPLAEQQRIADILWAADEVVYKYERLLYDFSIYMRQKIEFFLSSTEGKEYSLNKVLTGSPESGCSVPPSSEKTGHYVLSLAALSADGYIPENLKPVRPTQKMLGARLRKGDLLISRSNTKEFVGFAGIFNEDRNDVSFPDTMMRLPVDSEIIYPEYLEMVLLSGKGRKHMMKTASGTSSSMKKINRRTLSEFRFLVPDLSRQKRILEQILLLKDKRRTITAHINASRTLLLRLLNETVGACHT